MSTPNMDHQAADRKIQFVMLMRGLNAYMDGIKFMNKPLAIEMLRSLPERESRYNRIHTCNVL